MTKDEVKRALISKEPVVHVNEYGVISEYAYIEDIRIHRPGRWVRDRILDYSVGLCDKNSKSVIYVAAERVFRKADLPNS